MKTPTAAAEYLIANLVETATKLDELTALLATGITDRIHREEQRVESLAQRIPSLLSLIYTRGMHRLEQLEVQMTTALQRSLVEQKHRLALIEKIVEGASPQQILQRGYSITRCEGRVVRGVADLPEGAILTTTLLDGEVTSVVGF